MGGWGLETVKSYCLIGTEFLFVIILKSWKKIVVVVAHRCEWHRNIYLKWLKWPILHDVHFTT